MRFIADFHIHSKYSRATSKEMEVETLARWAKKKGLRSLEQETLPIHLFCGVKARLEPLGNGLLKLKKGDQRSVIF